MNIDDLLNGVQVLDKKYYQNIDITNISNNSKTIQPNGLFFCINGVNLNGSDFVLEAISNGASCIICESFLPQKIMQICVSDVRVAMSLISANFYQNAHKKLKIIGIVGTNGKSTCAYLIKSGLDKLNINSALIGTNEIIYSNKRLVSHLTTPDPIELNKLFFDFVESGVKVVVMEISAHSIFLKKLYGISFFVLALTNVQSDHLDFFKTQKLYESTKKSIFFEQKTANIILNTDDRVGNELSRRVRSQTYSLNHNAIITAKYCAQKQQVKIRFCDKYYYYNYKLLGKFNIYNQLLSILVLSWFESDFSRVIKIVANTEFINGRCNEFKAKNLVAIIDYAHTTNSLKEILKSIKQKYHKKMIAVVGCPGNRDEYKRKQFGEVLNKYCSFVFLSQDNPKYENPFRIMREMSRGIVDMKYVMVLDRKIAIKLAYQMAKKSNSILVILGKGMETYQDINGENIGYSDIFELKRLIGK